MRQDKTVARILLIFSVINVALEALAVVRQGHLDVAKDVTAASEKRLSSDEESSFNPSGSSGSTSSGETHSGMSTPEFFLNWLAEMGAPESDSEESLVSDRYSSEHSSFYSWRFLQAHGDSLASLSSTHYSTPPVSPPQPEHVSWTLPSSLSSSHSDGLVPSVAPEVDKFFNDELKQKMKEFAVLGTAADRSY